MNEAPEQTLDTDTLAKSMWARLSAFTEVGSRTTALALAELKLASASAALAICTAIVLILMLLVLWGLLLGAGFLFLRQSGFSALAAVGVLAMVQVTGCVLLAWLLNRLLQQMRFINTRQAMRKTVSNTIPDSNLRKDTQ